MSFRKDLKRIQAAALANKGGYVHYSQCTEPTATLINMLPYTEDGICQALSAKWIAEHANDRSLWSWLFVPGSTNVKQAAIANLMINFTESVQRTGAVSNPTTRSANTGGQFYQDFVTDKYLKLYGVVRRGLPQARILGSMGQKVKFGLGLKTGLQLAVRLQEKYLVSKGGSYVLISIMGDGGHAMAAFVGQDIAFFDPNFGEFYFPTTGDFRKFFKSFWAISGYIDDFESFYLIPYAKGA